MKNLLILAVAIGSITSLHAAADGADQRQIDAIQRIASAHKRFQKSWKEDTWACATKRAVAFTVITRLSATACYYDTSNRQSSLSLPASPHRVGLTGLLLGKEKVRCFVAHPDDPIPELTKPVEYHTYSLNDEERWTEPFYPTIWHFLASDDGKKVIEEYRSAAPSR